MIGLCKTWPVTEIQKSKFELSRITMRKCCASMVALVNEVGAVVEGGGNGVREWKLKERLDGLFVRQIAQPKPLSCLWSSLF
jgi:hypothetical protein